MMGADQARRSTARPRISNGRHGWRGDEYDRVTEGRVNVNSTGERRAWRVSAWVVAIAAAAVLAPPVNAQTAAAPEDIAAGMRIYRTKADCQACHGWAGDGKKMDSQMPDGANLRATKLDRDKVIMAIKCGIPGGKGMPAFDRLAYSDGRCYNLTQAAVKKMGAPPDPAATLQAREIELVADFLFAKVVGKGEMDRAKCIEYWGSDVSACAEFAK
jgi:mono/diheme cytochrome c family protein